MWSREEVSTAFTYRLPSIFKSVLIHVSTTKKDMAIGKGGERMCTKDIRKGIK